MDSLTTPGSILGEGVTDREVANVKVAETLHEWDVDYARARAIQEELAARVVLEPLPRRVRWVAGADMALSKTDRAFVAAVVVLSFPALEVVEEVIGRALASFPYIPGLLSFREAPAVADALRRVQRRADVILFDGQGLAHPRRLGLASHVGLWLGLPAVGAAKSRLIGEHPEPGEHKGDWTPLLDRGEQIGSVLRTRTGVKPLYVSPGHLCDHAGARRIVLECCTRYRLPEPTRRAHNAVSRARARPAGPFTTV
ncbi:MAG: deoxyribonuclease V [Candidatus Brocadiia bacterium]|nr:deoxyribonuclease V [Candidatus Brocadiia bacterium]